MDIFTAKGYATKINQRIGEQNLYVVADDLKDIFSEFSDKDFKEAINPAFKGLYGKDAINHLANLYWFPIYYETELKKYTKGA
jgi:hypothetical protein